MNQPAIAALIGAKARFAVQGELPAERQAYAFGRICLWAGGFRIGDYEQTVIVTVPAEYFRQTLRERGNRHDPALDGRSAEEVLRVVHDALFGDPGDAPMRTLVERRKRFAKFCICPNGSEAFDGDQMVLLEQQENARLIWRGHDETATQEIGLALGEYEGTIQSFLAWLDPVVGHDPLSVYFADQVFVFVGHLSHRTRAEAEALVRRLGGSVHRRVTRSTTRVTAGALSREAQATVNRARSLNIPVLTESEFDALLPRVAAGETTVSGPHADGTENPGDGGAGHRRQINDQ
jgi:hypothetical protein